MEEVINDYISDADSEPIQESYDKHNMPYLSKKTKKKMAKRHIVNDGKLFKRTKEHEDRDVSIAWALGRRSG